MAKGTFKTNPICTDIPANIAKQVGQITIKWAAFEYLIQSIIWLLCGVDEKIGRLAVRDPRIESRLTLLEDLALLKGWKIDTKTLKEFKNTASAIEAIRDLLGHSPWIYDDGQYKIIKFRGNIPDQDIKPQSRRVNPEAFAVTTDNLDDMQTNLDKLIKATKHLLVEAKKQLS